MYTHRAPGGLANSVTFRMISLLLLECATSVAWAGPVVEGEVGFAAGGTSLHHCPDAAFDEARIRLPDTDDFTFADRTTAEFPDDVVCNGFRPDFGYLDMPAAFDAKGRLIHDGGRVAEGLYVLGLPFLRRRRSTYIDGALDDARDIAAHLTSSLDIGRAA